LTELCGPEPNSQTLSVTFTAKDACGLESQCNSTVTIDNLTEIEIKCPESITVSCSDPDLYSIVQQQQDAIEIIATSEYETIQNFDESQLDVECEEPQAIEIGIAAIDICGNEDDCLTYVNVIPDPSIYIPNVFSPDRDGVNEKFTIYGNSSIDIVSSLVIYNRWGSKVFEATDMLPNDEDLGWDGNYKNSTESDYVFTYYAVILDTYGNKIEKVGTIQVLKEE